MANASCLPRPRRKPSLRFLICVVVFTGESANRDGKTERLEKEVLVVTPFKTDSRFLSESDLDEEGIVNALVLATAILGVAIHFVSASTVEDAVVLNLNSTGIASELRGT